MTVYLDIVFLENLIINYIIIYLTGIISKSKITYWKIFVGSLIGAIYSIIYYLFNFKIYGKLILKIILSIIIIYVSFKSTNLKTLIKQISLFYIVSFIFGGVAIATIYAVDTKNITIKDGVLIGNYTIKTILIGIILGLVITLIGFSFLKIKISKKDLLCEISFKLNKKQIKTNVMIDTGNFLKEPITNMPVIVLEHTLFYNIIPKEILNNIENILGGDLSKISEEIQNKYINKFRVIPFSSLGKQNGMLLGIKIENIVIKKDDVIKNIDKAVIGLYNKSLTKKGEYRGLVGIGII